MSINLYQYYMTLICLGSVKAGIRDRTSEYIVSENSWPLFVYENYSVNNSNLEQGLFMSKVLVQVSSFGSWS